MVIRLRFCLLLGGRQVFNIKLIMLLLFLMWSSIVVLLIGLPTLFKILGNVKFLSQFVTKAESSYLIFLYELVFLNTQRLVFSFYFFYTAFLAVVT